MENKLLYSVVKRLSVKCGLKKNIYERSLAVLLPKVTQEYDVLGMTFQLKPIDSPIIMEGQIGIKNNKFDHYPTHMIVYASNHYVPGTILLFDHRVREPKAEIMLEKVPFVLMTSPMILLKYEGEDAEAYLKIIIDKIDF